MEVAWTDWIPVTDASSVGEARRRAQLLAERIGFDATRTGELALLATESSRNVLLHGRGGEMVILGMLSPRHSLARILAIDGGPGIANVTRAMEDGYSTAGTMGGGLGAMRRIATNLDVFTGKTGTILLIELGETVRAADNLHIAGMAVPRPGERFCGDAWAFHHAPERMVVLLSDGLGHGLDAAEASKEAIATFHKRQDLAPGVILGYIHDALKKTRGAVAAVAEIRPREGVMIYAGVGNISAVVLAAGASRSLVSHNGTLGMVTSRVQEFRIPWTSDAVLVLHSDGLQSRWDLAAYPGLIARNPALIGGILLRDFRRQRDDASVVVVKAA